MQDWLEWVGPPWPEEPKARIALWMHADDYFESYYVSALIWKEKKEKAAPIAESGRLELQAFSA